MNKVNRVRGFSVSVNDVLAGAASAVGLVLSVFVGRSVGSLALEATGSGSLWIGTCAWVATILVGAILFLGGIAYVMSASRTYVHPGTDTDQRASAESAEVGVK